MDGLTPGRPPASSDRRDVAASADAYAGSDLRRWRLYGIQLASRFPFEASLPVDRPDGGPCRSPDLTFVCMAPGPSGAAVGPAVAGDRRAPALPSGAEHAGDGAPPSGGMPSSDPLRVDVPGVAAYHLRTDRVIAHPHPAADAGMVELHFLGNAMTAWLERRRTLALHASACVVDGRAVAFLASHRGGKTALAAACMREGFPLLTDDVLAVQVAGSGSAATGEPHHAAREHFQPVDAGVGGAPIAYPGYPQMRMWDDNAREFVGEGWERLPPVHPRYPKRRVVVADDLPGASFHGRAVPLGLVLLPDRRAADAGDGSIVIEPLGPTAAVSALLEHTFSANVLTDARRQADRLPRLAAVAARTPVMSLRYPDGYERLPAVVRRVADALTRPQRPI